MRKCEAFTNTLFTEEARIKKKDITKQMEGVRNELPGYPLQGGWGHGGEEKQQVFSRSRSGDLFYNPGVGHQGVFLS